MFKYRNCRMLVRKRIVLYIFFFLHTLEYSRTIEENKKTTVKNKKNEQNKIVPYNEGILSSNSDDVGETRLSMAG